MRHIISLNGHRFTDCKRIAFALVVLLLTGAMSLNAQTAKPSAPKKSKAKVTLKARPATPAAFTPTCNLDPQSVGSYFFPANLDAMWRMRTVMQVFDGENKLLKSDTLYSFERVLSDSNRTIQGLPVIECASSMPYKAGDEVNAKVQRVEYYVDDSIVVAIFNHSMTSEMNHYLLVNPLRVGAHWKDSQADTIASEIISMEEPVTVPAGSFKNAVVVRTQTKNSELSKYFVSGEGIVKTVYRGIPPTAKGTFVVTTELIYLDRGDESHSVKSHFPSRS